MLQFINFPGGVTGLLANKYNKSLEMHGFLLFNLSTLVLLEVKIGRLIAYLVTVFENCFLF